MYFVIALIVGVISMFTRQPATPTGRHAVGNVDTVEDDYNPLPNALRFRIRAAALRGCIA